MQIRFIKFGANSMFGGFAPGDTMRCSPDMAKHMVDELGVAEYIVKAEPKKLEEPKKQVKTKAK